MTTAQWLYHYLEICHHQKRDFKLEIEKIRAGSSDIRRNLKYLMLVTEPERGKKAVEAIEEEEANRYNNENNENNESTNNKKSLNNEDQELWDWMQTTPETKALPKQVTDQINDRRFIVEAKSLSDIQEDLGLIGMNEKATKQDEGEMKCDEDIQICDEKPTRQPMRIQSIGNINEEEIPLGFELE